MEVASLTQLHLNACSQKRTKEEERIIFVSSHALIGSDKSSGAGEAPPSPSRGTGPECDTCGCCQGETENGCTSRRKSEIRKVTRGKNNSLVQQFKFTFVEVWRLR